MENSKELLEQRLKIFDDTIRFQKPDRIPTYGNVYNWKVVDSEHTVEEAGENTAIAEKVLREFHERYQFDVYQNPGQFQSGMRWKILGKERVHNIVEGNSAVTVDRAPMESTDEEIREYYANPVKFLWTKTAPRLYKEGEGLTLGGAKKLIAHNLEYRALDQKVNDILLGEYGVPHLTPMVASRSTFLHPLENYGMTRGLKNFGLDLRRRKELIKEIIAPQEEAMFEAVKNMLATLDMTGSVFNVFTTVMMNTVMSVKQFEELYYPLMKKQFDYIEEQGKRVFLLCEADYIRFAELFNDYPKGMICLLPEMEDVRDIRKASPNMVICGGMPVDLLGQGTPEECVEYEKRLIDDMGYGFILGQNKFLSYEYDAKRENLLAVQEYALNYKY